MLWLLWCSSGTCVCRDGGCTSEFLSHTAGYQQMFCPARAAGWKRTDCSSVLQGESLLPFKLASLSGVSYILRINRCFLEKDWRRLRGDQKPSHLYLDISLSLYSLLFQLLYCFSIKCLLVASYNNQILYFLFWMGNTSVQFPMTFCGLLRALWVYRSAPVWKGHKCWSHILSSSPHFLNSLVFD